MTLAIDKLNGSGFSNNPCRERLPKKNKLTRYYLQKYQTVATSQSVSVIKVSEQICSNAFKCRQAFGFSVIISA